MIAEASGTGTIAEFLQPLERFGCRRLDSRSIPSTGADVDHVLIAPPGVFVIAAKTWDGRIEASDGVLRRDGFAQVADVDDLVGQASALSAMLDSWTGETVTIPVHAVMAFIGTGQIGGWAALTGAHAVDGRNLAEFITKFPAAVGIEHVNWAYQALDDHLPIRIPASPPAIDEAPAAPAPALKLVPPVDPTPVVESAPPVVVPPAAPQFVAAAPPAATPAVSDGPRQVPNEPIVFLSRSSAPEHDRFYVRDEEGYPGGYLDLRTGQGVDLTPIAEAVLQQMLPAFLPDGGQPIDELPFEVQSAIRYYLGSPRAHAGAEVPAVVVCSVGHSEGRGRLYASLLQPGNRRTDLGWIDLTDRRTQTDVPGVDPILRYCGDAFAAVAAI